ncbi:hypothetical protein L915_20166 [Phytophthora nicotianae]|nr:hypothetical protein L915_20166 [Phytophthora nicotianae]
MPTYTTSYNTNPTGAENSEIVGGRCFPGSWNWPRCRFWCMPGSWIWPRCRWGGRRCYPGSWNWPRCRYGY